MKRWPSTILRNHKSVWLINEEVPGSDILILDFRILRIWIFISIVLDLKIVSPHLCCDKDFKKILIAIIIIIINIII